MIRLSHDRARVFAREYLFALLAGLLGFAAPLPRVSPRRRRPIGNRRGIGYAPTITYRKVFKSSYPEFVEIKLNQSGHGTFDIRQLDEEPNPQPFRSERGARGKNFCD